MSKKTVTIDPEAKLSNDALAECLDALEGTVKAQFAEIDRATTDIKLLQAKLKASNLGRKEGFIEFAQNDLILGYDFTKRQIYVRSTQPDSINTPLLSASGATRMVIHSYGLDKLVRMITDDFVNRRTKGN